MNFVSCTHPARLIVRAGQPLQIVHSSVLSRELDAIVVQLSIGHREYCLQHLAPEFVANSLLEHCARVTILHTILNYIMENSGDYSVAVASVPSENDCHVRRMREVGKPRAFSHLAIVMLRRKSESMIDDIRVARSAHQAVANQDMSCSKPRWSSASNALRRSESTSNTATKSPRLLSTGITISDRERASQLMCPENFSTSGTTTLFISAAAVPHTP